MIFHGIDMMKKTLIYAFTAALMVCSCMENKSWDGISPDLGKEEEKTLHLLAEPYTRAVVNEDDFSVEWTAGDKISILDGVKNREFVTAEGGSLGRFTGIATKTDTYVAVYPYNESVSLSDGVLFIDFPSEQTPVSGTIPSPSSSIWVGKSRGTLIEMNNISATVSFEFNSEDIESVVIYGNNSEKLTGSLYLTFGDDDQLYVSQSQLSGTEITLLPSVGQHFTPGRYSVSLLPGEYPDGFSLKFVRSGSSKPTIRRANSLSSIQAGSYADLGTFDLDSPELMSVVTKAASEISGSGALLNGAMEIERFSSAKVSCGFEYRTSDSQEWSSVTCETSSVEYSYGIKGLPYSSEPVVYRAWAMVDSYKVYGEEQTFTMTPVHTVTFDFVVPEESYKKNAQILNTWNFGTNGKLFKNKTDEQKNEYNAMEWNYPVDGTDYSFRFWCRIDQGGFCTRAITHDNGLPTEHYTYHGMCLNYSSGSDCYSWMLLPAVQGARLISAEVQLYDKKSKITMTADVHQDGTAVESSVIENQTSPNVNYGSVIFNCPETEFGKRYYLSTVIGRTTITNLTLTYQYE